MSKMPVFTSNPFLHYPPKRKPLTTSRIKKRKFLSAPPEGESPPTPTRAVGPKSSRKLKYVPAGNFKYFGRKGSVDVFINA
jgi:hypothetical protein